MRIMCQDGMEYIIRIRTPWDGLGKLERGERWLEEDGLEDLYGPLEQAEEEKKHGRLDCFVSHI